MLCANSLLNDWFGLLSRVRYSIHSTFCVLGTQQGGQQTLTRMQWWCSGRLQSWGTTASTTWQNILRDTGVGTCDGGASGCKVGEGSQLWACLLEGFEAGHVKGVPQAHRVVLPSTHHYVALGFRPDLLTDRQTGAVMAKQGASPLLCQEIE